MEVNIEELKAIYLEQENITHSARIYAEQNGIEFSDSFRRKCSKYLNGAGAVDEIVENITKTDTNQYGGQVGQLSALKPDGTIMPLKEYCKFYGIPFDEVRTYKLVTHSSKGAYYNIASNPIKGEGFEQFYQALLKELSELPNKPKTLVKQRLVLDESYLLVVDAADCHIGKLADSFETGEDYNSQIAVQRIREGVEGIIEKTKGFPIDKILFVGGNDILHIDTPKNTTTAGTHQNTSGMWYSNFLMAKDIYIEVLNRLLEISDIHFVFNPSNHDYFSGFFLADVIKTYYKDCNNISFDCSIAHRKYFTYGQNLIGTAHGDGGKMADLPLTMAHESKDWSSCKHKYFYVHHFHHKISKDYMGVNVEALRSPSSTDSWHSRNQYHFSPKAIEGFLHSKEHGQIARITHLF